MVESFLKIESLGLRIFLASGKKFRQITAQISAHRSTSGVIFDYHRFFTIFFLCCSSSIDNFSAFFLYFEIICSSFFIFLLLLLYIWKVKVILSFAKKDASFQTFSKLFQKNFKLFLKVLHENKKWVWKTSEIFWFRNSFVCWTLRDFGFHLSFSWFIKFSLSCWSTNCVILINKKIKCC